MTALLLWLVDVVHEGCHLAQLILRDARQTFEDVFREVGEDYRP